MKLKKLYYRIIPTFTVIQIIYRNLGETKILLAKNKDKPKIQKWHIESYDLENGDMIFKLIRKQRIYE